jgi:hypothetical protein
MTKKLEILKNSLEKKLLRENVLFDKYLALVKSANGQPLNDKRGGHKVMQAWEKKEEAIRSAIKESEKTKSAIEREQNKIERCENVNSTLPDAILSRIENGTLTQWRKYPNRFFVVGVEKARLIYENDKLKFSHKQEIPTPEQTAKFEAVAIEIYNELKE